MQLIDRVLLGLRWRLWERDWGITVWAMAGWVISRIAPYRPPHTEISPDRINAFKAVEVRISSIPSGGKGLFALERIEAGETVGEYTGDIVESVLKCMRLRNKDYVALSGDPTIFIDASSRPDIAMRYVNHGLDESARNLKFRNEGSRKYLVATRIIEAGEELLSDYGDIYWRLRKISPNGPATHR